MRRYKKTTLGEAVAFYKDNDPRGEYVLVLAGTDPAAVEQAAAPTLEEAVAAARALQAGGLAPRRRRQTGRRRDTV